MKARNKILPPVHPNVGLEVEYRAKLNRLIEEMARSYYHWIRAQYRETPPVLAQDETPAKALEREMSLLGKRWQKKFDETAPKLAGWFAQSTSRRSSAALQKILRDGGLSVDFKVTPAMRDAYQATIAEQVGLIKSIGSQYHTEIQGMVMRSVTAGRDLASLTKELQHRHGITERRAALIALDQNNKATAVFTRCRQQEAGITRAVWLHSAAGKSPRPTHVAMNGKSYDVTKGMWDSAVKEWIFPGTLINCRCQSKSIVKGFS